MLTESELDKIGILLVANNEKLIESMKETFVEQKTAYKWAAGGMAWVITSGIALIFSAVQYIKPGASA
jgi:hypothetical protein